MWGNIITEATFAQNYNFGFLNSRSDIILHITHWQHWYWFWFTYFIVLYYFFFLRLIRYRSMKMKPKLTTSFRSHGKWGDFIICLLPISWCVNILSNSNFILRMIEWQSESCLFTVRIRGKQWYWVYKFEVRTLAQLAEIPVNMGSGLWKLTNNYNFNDLFWVKEKHDLEYNLITWNTYLNSYNNPYFKNVNTINVNDVVENKTIDLKNIQNKPVFKSLWAPSYYYNYKNMFFNTLYKNELNGSLSQNLKTNPKTLFNSISVNGTNSEYPVSISRTSKLNSVWTPLRLVKNTSKNKLELQISSNQIFNKKDINNNLFLVIKQKRFAGLSFSRNKEILSDRSYLYELNNIKAINHLSRELRNMPYEFNISSNKRLLRTRRILVLPTHINVGIITNSFDVMHSWFVPGLGIKLDCVPGRSTHHILHIDHAGFYYGQCAEICGRYHHHMPIRVCALPFEHFLLWWYNYGSPFFLANSADREKFAANSTSIFNW